MKEAVIAARKPVRVEPKAGNTYRWRRCGRSEKRPFCDGSDGVSTFKPVGFEAKDAGAAYPGMRKRKGNAPYGDATHCQLPPEPAASEGRRAVTVSS